MSFSEKSDQEISDLLTVYGIKHGPVVDSTRTLYEMKLQEAMEQSKTPSPNKTYYREEVEEVTYVTYQTPVQHEAHGDMLRRRGSYEQPEEKEPDRNIEPPMQSARAANHSKEVQSSQPTRKSAGGMPTVTKLLLLALVVAFFYYVYCCMAGNVESPIGQQQ